MDLGVNEHENQVRCFTERVNWV